MYYLFRIATIVVPWLPNWLIWAIGHAAGLIAWLVATKAREQATENMLHVLGPQILNSSAGRRKLRRTVQAMFRYNVVNYLTLFSVPTRTSEQLLRDISITGLEHLEAALARGKGVIICSAHVGPFNYIVQWMALSGYDLTIPVEHLKDQRMLNLITDLRSSHGTAILPLGGSAPMRTILQKLRANKIILLTADRAIEGQSKEMPFFGAMTPMPVGVPHLAQRTGATVVGAFGWYAPDGTIHGNFLPLSLALSEEQRTNVDDLQQAIVTMLEQGISKHPEQWLVFEPLWTERPSATHKAMVMKGS